MANGDRGVMLIDLEAKDTLAGAAAYARSVRIAGIGCGGKGKGKAADLGVKPASVTRVEQGSQAPALAPGAAGWCAGR